MLSCKVPGATVAPQVQGFREAVRNASPALDSVEFWLTHTIKHDYELRGVFHDLCAPAPAARNGSGWQLRFVSIAQAEAVLVDCVQRASSVRGGLLNAYRNHERRMRESIVDAADRPALFESAEPRCFHRVDTEERWIGTREQLDTLGIRPLGAEAWPREAGRGGIKIFGKDARDYSACVLRSANLWPQLFEVAITLPQSKRAKPPLAQRKLADLATTPGTFRQRASACFEHVAFELRKLLLAELGYRYSKEAVDTFMDVMAEAREVLRAGEIVGRSRDQEMHRLAALQAKDDKPLQNFLAGLRDLPNLPGE
jgi:hypothetical protein